MAVTIYDVAEHAGVSPRTVSNVVNDYPFVAPETRRRVKESLRALGYRPNITARNLRRGGRTSMIAVAIPELGVPYFSELCQAIIDAASERSYAVLIEQTEGDPQAELEVLQRCESVHMADGLILSQLGLERSELLPVTGSFPLVLLGERASAGPFDHVTIDNVAAACRAVEHLVSIGCRRIAAIGDQPYDTGETAQLRARGYRQAIEAAGHSYDQTLVVPVSRFHRQAGAEAVTKLLSLADPPDALFCYNDLLAAGAIRALLARGLRVPEDVAVVGFDDIEEGRYSTPTLSTISPDKAQIAGMAVTQLLRRIEGKGSEPLSLEAGYTLEERESTLGSSAPTRAN